MQPICWRTTSDLQVSNLRITMFSNLDLCLESTVVEKAMEQVKKHPPICKLVWLYTCFFPYSQCGSRTLHVRHFLADKVPCAKAFYEQTLSQSIGVLRKAVYPDFWKDVYITGGSVIRLVGCASDSNDIDVVFFRDVSNNTPLEDIIQSSELLATHGLEFTKPENDSPSYYLCDLESNGAALSIKISEKDNFDGKEYDGQCFISLAHLIEYETGERTFVDVPVHIAE